MTDSCTCPICASKTLYKDGLRYLKDGTSVQRWICRSCGHRFTEKKPLQKNSNCQINRRSTSSTYRQVCELLQESKNLTENTRQEAASREGTKQDDAEVKGKIVEFSFWLLKQGYSQATIKGRVKLLNRLMRLGANFNDENSVKEIIAKQEWSVSRKVNAVDAYDSFLRIQGKTWTPPIYRRIRKLPFIPNETELDQLIAGCSKRMATFLQLLKETGMRCGEACELLKWTDIDSQQRSIRITPEKGSNPRILPISAKLIDMLNEMPKNTVTVFGVNADMMRHNFHQQRRRIAARLKNLRIKQITFHTFRHWKATMEYYKTRDILHVKQVLGHKSLDNTMLYTQLISFKDDDFTANVAHSEEEACKLVEAGFEYVCDFNRNKIFRKRK
jgi:integrase